MRVGFDLEGAVVDPISVGDQMPRLVEYSVVIDSLTDHQVSRRGIHLRSERPHMQVVNVDDTRQRSQVAPKCPEVDSWRRRLQQHVHRLSAEPPRARQDPQADEHTHDWIGPPPAEQLDRKRCKNDPDRSDHVGHDLEVRALDVDRLARSAPEQCERDNIDDESEHGDHQHRAAADLWPTAETTNRFDHHEHRDTEQNDGVDECGQDLQPNVSRVSSPSGLR